MHTEEYNTTWLVKDNRVNKKYNYVTRSNKSLIIGRTSNTLLCNNSLQPRICGVYINSSLGRQQQKIDGLLTYCNIKFQSIRTRLLRDFETNYDIMSSKKAYLF